MQDELTRFVQSLAIPAERKDVVLAELVDHVASAREAALREGRDPDAAARAALGDLEALRRSLEAIERGFRVTRWHAALRGVAAGLLVALVLDQGGAMMRGVLGAALAVAIAALLAPPRALALLRAELRASRVPGVIRAVRGVPIGPAVTYLYTAMAAPFLVWIALIVARASRGETSVDTPWAAFALPVAITTVIVVEALRARRPRTA